MRVTVESGRRAVAERHPPARAAALILGGDATIASRASTARAATEAPSSTRCGASRRSDRSFLLAGSPSEPLATTMDRPRAATARIFAPPERTHPRGHADRPLHQGDGVPRRPAPQIGNRPMHFKVIFEIGHPRSPTPARTRGSSAASAATVIAGRSHEGCAGAHGRLCEDRAFSLAVCGRARGLGSTSGEKRRRVRCRCSLSEVRVRC